MTPRARITRRLLLTLAPLAACGRTEDDLSDWKLLSAAGRGGAAGASGASSKAGSAGAGQAGAAGGAGAAGSGKGGAAQSGQAGAMQGGQAGAGATAGQAGASGGGGMGGMGSFVCVGTATPLGFPLQRRCFEPFEGGCPEIGLGIVQPDLPELCGITCQFGGPVPPEPGDPGSCCYLVEEVCEGRPLLVGGRQVVARLRRAAAWC